MINPFLNHRLLFGYVLSLLVAISPVAIARYNPPRTQKPPTSYSKSSGVRGGCTDVSLKILAPKEYVGETISRRPTFAWFVSKSTNVEFRLFEFDKNDDPKRISKPIKLPSSGITKYSLPESQPKLAVGKKYLWKVSIKCSEVDADLIEAAEFTVRKIPSTLSSKLSSSKSRLDKIELYAQKGLWYDALAEALQLEEKQQNVVVTDLREDLEKSERGIPH